MGKLNGPREVDYDFRVIEIENIVWLVDWSSRTYPCSSRSHVWMEYLYAVDHTEDAPADLDSLFPVSDISEEGLVKVPVDIPMDTSREDAWDEAREEAQANHLI